MLNQGWEREQDPFILVSKMQQVWIDEKRQKNPPTLRTDMMVKRAAAGGPVSTRKPENQLRLCLTCTKFAINCMLSSKSVRDLPPVRKHECSGELPFAFMKGIYLSQVKLQNRRAKGVSSEVVEGEYEDHQNFKEI